MKKYLKGAFQGVSVFLLFALILPFLFGLVVPWVHNATYRSELYGAIIGCYIYLFFRLWFEEKLKKEHEEFQRKIECIQINYQWYTDQYAYYFGNKLKEYDAEILFDSESYGIIPYHVHTFALNREDLERQIYKDYKCAKINSIVEK